MTFRSLALSNVKGNWRSYSAFFLSSAFSVMIFYIYAAFLLHPDVVSGYILSASKVRPGMKFCLYIIIIFSFLFILYSNSAFLKTRKQEFGLFSLFGMTKAQLRRLVIYENTVIAALAIAAGIGLGVLFSKLFFMALAALLKMEQSISFAVPMQAVGLTAGGFFLLFLVISIWTVFRMGRAEIVELLAARRQPKGKLVYSRWLVLLAAVCLASGYGMATVMDNRTFLMLAMPILITVVIGTYFLFTQLSIVLLRLLQKRHGLYYKRTNMLILAQLGYKIRDNARILFMVSILSAVIMTAMGTVYIMQIQGKQDVLATSPYTLAVTERGLHAHEVINPDALKNAVEEAGFRIARESKVVGVPLDYYQVHLQEGDNHMRLEGESALRLGRGDVTEFTASAMIISASDYNRLAKEQGKAVIEVESGQLTLLYPRFDGATYRNGTVAGRINGESVQFPVSETANVRVLNNWIRSNALTFVMDDLSFINLVSNLPEERQAVFYGYELANWEKAAPLVGALNGLISPGMEDDADFGRAERYDSMNETVSLTLFIGMFISLLFFIAAGSIIYFKLFTELQEDQAQFKGLSRVGMTHKEMRRIVVAQIGIIFFIPCVVGISHALFAMTALDNMMNTSNWLYSFVVIGIYVGMQTLYFLLASGSYMRSMTRGSIAA